MRIKSWLALSSTTLVIGVITAYLVAFIFRGADLLTFFGFENSGLGGTYLLLLGLLFSVVSQALFFSYQFIQYFATSLLGTWMWKYLQVILVLITGIDLGYLRWVRFPDQSMPFWMFLDWTFILILGTFLVVWMKVKMTNANAWVPGFFYMIVSTVIGAFYAFKTYQNALIWFVVLPIFLCNAWQLIMLPYFLTSKKMKITRNDSVTG